jgi:lipopolysaccharide export system permease protein
VVNRGLSTGTVVRLALLEAIPLAAQMFPFSVLIGCLVALGRLGADREILALESLGISGSRLVGPVVTFAATMTLLAIPLSLVAGPWASRERDRAMERISRETPWAQIRAGAVNQFGGWQLQALEASPKGDRLRRVFLWMPRLGETVFAERGELRSAAGGGLELGLESGSVVLSTDDGPRHVRFERMATSLPSTDVLAAELNRLESLTHAELADAAAEFVPTELNPLPQAALLLHRRFALPTASLVFGFLAAPLFFVRRRFSRAGGGLLGLLCTGAYYGLVQLGQGLVGGGRIGPAAAAWLPNAVLLLLGIALFIRARVETVIGSAFERGPRRERRWWRSEASGGRRDERIRPAQRLHGPRRWPLPRYVGLRFIELAGLAFGALLTAYLVIDVMERLSWFTYYQASGGEALRYYLTRVPMLAARVIPMALLVATALLVSLLAVDGELIGMRACGIPVGRALVPALVLSALVVPGFFLFKSVAVPHAYLLGEKLKRTEIKADFNAHLSRERAPVWLLTGDKLIEAERFDQDRGSASGVTIYELDARGLPTLRTDARDARHIGRGIWRLRYPSSIRVSDGRVAAVPPRRFADLGLDLRAEVDTREFPLPELLRQIEEVEASGYDATMFRVDLHVRFAEALSCVVLPAVALFFAAGGPPFPGPAQNLLVSGILGVGYILMTSVSASFAQRGTLPAFLGGWAPMLFFGGLAAFFGARMMRRL